MIKEFKKFISRGNVLDLAVGIIVGGAFGKIVSSIVNDIIMPIIGIIIGGINFSSLKIVVKGTSINYGTFIQNIIDFLIISFCVFIIVKFANKFRIRLKNDIQKKEEKSEEVELLTEIKNLLKEKRKKEKNILIKKN